MFEKRNNRKIIIVSASLFFILFFLISTYIDNQKSKANLESISHTNEDKQKSEKSNKKTMYIDLEGAVKKPGMYEFTENDRLGDMVKKAGGFKDANRECINLAEPLQDGVKIVIPQSDEKCDKPKSNSQNKNLTTEKSENSDLININLATKEELMTLSGIGDVKADSIIEYREKDPFTKKEDLKNVSGIGDVTYQGLENKITV